MANLLALFYVMFSCVFVTFSCAVLGQVWYLFVLIPDLGLFPSVYITLSGLKVYSHVKSKSLKISVSEDTSV